MKSYEKLELFGTLYEANDTVLIRSCIKDINFSHESFTTVGMHAMSLVMRRCSQLESVRLQNCDLNAELVHILKSNLKGSSLKLNKLDVRYNKNLGTDGFGELGLVVTQCQVKTFDAGNCNLTAEGIKAFKENTGNVKIKCLILSGNQVSRLGDEGLSTISEIVHQCQVESLWMVACYFNPDQLERFKASIADTGVIFRGN
uniref:ribonuclease inhibitor-like n=1 Tax=Styela clava TaxID=7725 RepID=UPI001939EDAC|nr:ribonuclease inhibitor-like [Styela clava]